MIYFLFYGIRIEDKEIFLGLVDVYYIYVVYELLDDLDFVIFFVILVELFFFVIGFIVIGKIFGVCVCVVDFNFSIFKLIVVYFFG